MTTVDGSPLAQDPHPRPGPTGAAAAVRTELSANQRTTRLDCGRGELPLAGRSTVVHAFQAVVAARPAAEAVRDEQRGLSFARLDAASSSLAARLCELGAGPGERVAVCLDRSVSLVVGLLGVLKSGAAYVPVDPAYPRERVNLVLADASVVALVSSAQALTGLPDLAVPHSARVLLSSQVDTARVTNSQDREPAAGPADPAYIIYTSGSTGQPKGVVVEHRSLMHLLLSMAGDPGLAPGETMVGVTTPAFDLSVPDLFLPLVTGGRLVLAGREETVDGRALGRLLEAVDARLMQATPTTWRLLLDSAWTGRPQLRAVAGGEAVPARLARALAARTGGVWNFYGPTEATVWCTSARLDGPTGAGLDEPLTIGRPLPGVELFVVDPSDRLVPAGVVGELLIGGPGVARAYWNRPELTARRFVRLPVSDGRRVYRTGDLVRWRVGGWLEFVGRVDHQVKVHGHRIEPGEVESALRRHPDVPEAVVVVGEDASGDRRLVGYVTLRAGSSLAPSELRSFVARVLPAHMVPAAVTVLERIPTTPNGKLDRAALPAPDAALTGRSHLAVAPRDELEARLLRIWRQVLGVGDIGVTDDFFSLGVSSLTAGRLFARIERELGRQLPLAPVFQAPTVERLAQLLRDGTRARRWSSLVPIQPGGTRPPIFGVHGGAGTVLLYQALADRLGPEQPFYGLQAAGLYGGHAPDITVEAMASRYVLELRTVQPGGPYTLAGYCFGGIVAFEMGQQLRRLGECVDLVVMLNAPSPTYHKRYRPIFDAEGPLADAEGNLLRGKKTRRGDGLRRVWAQAREQRDLPYLAAVLVGHAVKRVRRRNLWLRFRRAMAHRRPLPASLREGWFFQYLAARAQSDYGAWPANFPLLVVRAEGLYHEPDLGWSAFSSAPVSDFEVPGHQRIPRETMQEPHVGYLADRLAEALADFRIPYPRTAATTSLAPEQLMSTGASRHAR